nr:spidroin-1-like [Aegilops tauschii subsp. strangulata]
MNILTYYTHKTEQYARSYGRSKLAPECGIIRTWRKFEGAGEVNLSSRSRSGWWEFAGGAPARCGLTVAGGADEEGAGLRRRGELRVGRRRAPRGGGDDLRRRHGEAPARSAGSVKAASGSKAMAGGGRRRWVAEEANGRGRAWLAQEPRGGGAVGGDLPLAGGGRGRRRRAAAGTPTGRGRQRETRGAGRGAERSSGAGSGSDGLGRARPGPRRAAAAGEALDWARRWRR